MSEKPSQDMLDNCEFMDAVLEILPVLGRHTNCKTGRLDLSSEIAQRSLDAAKWRVRARQEQPYIGEIATEALLTVAEEEAKGLVSQLVQGQAYTHSAAQRGYEI